MKALSSNIKSRLLAVVFLGVFVALSSNIQAEEGFYQNAPCSIAKKFNVSPSDCRRPNQSVVYEVPQENWSLIAPPYTKLPADTFSSVGCEDIPAGEAQNHSACKFHFVAEPQGPEDCREGTHWACFEVICLCIEN